jgi:hypothetical protein
MDVLSETCQRKYKRASTSYVIETHHRCLLTLEAARQEKKTRDVSKNNILWGDISFSKDPFHELFGPLGGWLGGAKKFHPR